MNASAMDNLPNLEKPAIAYSMAAQLALNNISWGNALNARYF